MNLRNMADPSVSAWQSVIDGSQAITTRTKPPPCSQSPISSVSELQDVSFMASLNTEVVTSQMMTDYYAINPPCSVIQQRIHSLILTYATYDTMTTDFIQRIFNFFMWALTTAETASGTSHQAGSKQETYLRFRLYCVENSLYRWYNKLISGRR
jgi:hypothetical protein